MSFFKTNDGVSLNYHVYGDSNNQAVILIEGYSSSEVTWILQIQSFIKEGFYVVTYDHRLHGKSEKVDFGLSIQRLALDLKELLDYLDIEKPIFIGHSMGSTTILAFEQMFTDGDLLAVISEDQSPTFLKTEGWLGGSGKVLAELSQFMDDFPKTHLTKKPLDPKLKRVLGKGMLPFDFNAGRPLLRNVITQDWRSVLKYETVPHLFLAGSESPVFPPEHAAAALALNKNKKSEAYMFEGCGHIPHLESPEEFDTVVIRFINKLEYRKK